MAVPIFTVLEIMQGRESRLIKESRQLKIKGLQAEGLIEAKVRSCSTCKDGKLGGKRK